MEQIFQSTLNTRPILENSLRYIRSDVPTEVTESERAWLVENEITTIVDLRTDEERSRKVCPLEHDCRFQYCIRPVTGGSVVPSSVNEVVKSYIKMADEHLHRTVQFIMDSKANVLYFCNAGKDRTGVLSAVLLYKSGKQTDYIVDDYMKSEQNLSSMLNAFAKQNPEISIDVITPQRIYIESFLTWFVENESCSCIKEA